ncbi:MAG: peptide chain release factor N(5)-glutamine methyltransferase [Clostridia bacterium]|nr:peptide chain release factor N(5)-glutamine methyltransferase [Clostridia bacterium]
MTLKEAINLLAQAGVEYPEHDARELFIAFGGFSRSMPPRLSDFSDSPALVGAVARRAAREPLQYIIGEVGFCHETYRVSPAVLIPRQDTELLVLLSAKRLPTGARFLDLCTGSGCVGISTLRATESTVCHAVDVSPAALDVARENAALNSVAERFFTDCRDLCAEDTPRALSEGAPYFAVLANPPYIRDSLRGALGDEVAAEPDIALFGGEDGADFYRLLTPICRELIEANGFIAYEIGFDQGEIIKEIARSAGMSAEVYTDLAGLDRVAILKRID